MAAAQPLTYSLMFSDFRSFLYGGIRTLPMTMASFMLVIGLLTANYAYLFFLVGLFLAVPFLYFCANSFFDVVLSFVSADSWFRGLCMGKQSDLCGVILPFATGRPGGVGVGAGAGGGVYNAVPTLWMSMFVFFIGYLFFNALDLARRPEDASTAPTPSAAATAYGNRMSQAAVALFTIGVVALLVTGVRYAMTGCETVLGVVVAFALFTPLAYGWYRFQGAAGEGRLADLFGIMNRLLPPNAVKNAPIGCFPVGGGHS